MQAVFLIERETTRRQKSARTIKQVRKFPGSPLGGVLATNQASEVSNKSVFSINNTSRCEAEATVVKLPADPTIVSCD